MFITKNQNKSYQQREIRCFGKDITNLPKLNLNCKKLPPFEMHQSTQIKVKDPINDYIEDIKRFMHFKQESDTSRMVSEQQSEITPKMKQILIDWLVDVHQSFELKEETFHLAILYLQQFQMVESIRKEDYQLVGITCLWIASKYEEIYPPSLKNYVEVTAKTYTALQIKETEGKILESINFNLVRITPLAILLAHSHTNVKTNALTKYLLELAYLQGTIFCKYGPRVMTTAAVKLAQKICNSSSDLCSLSENTPLQVIQQCEKELCLLLQGQNKYKLTAIRRKFSKQKYMGVGKLKIHI